MRAYHLENAGSLDRLVMREVDAPQPGPGQLLVRLRAATVNLRDLTVIYDRYVHAIPPGIVPLSDGAGEVVAIGEDVTRFGIGDRVATNTLQRWVAGPRMPHYSGSGLGGSLDGVLREYALFGEDGVVALPSHLSFAQGAALGLPALAAWTALTTGRPLRPGDSVLLQGSGNVALAAALLAPLFGARVIATTRRPAKAERLRAIGIDTVIDLMSTSDWGAAARAWAGTGVDRIVNVVGPTSLDQSIGALATNGHLSLVGALGGPGGFNPMTLVGRGIVIEGIGGGSREQFAALMRAVEHHRVAPTIDRIFPFEDAHAAIRDYEREDRFGRTVIAIG